MNYYFLKIKQKLSQGVREDRRTWSSILLLHIQTKQNLLHWIHTMKPELDKRSNKTIIIPTPLASNKSWQHQTKWKL